MKSGRLEVGNEAQIARKYMWKKIVRIIPYTTIAYVLMYSYYFIQMNDSIVRQSLIVQCIWDFLLLQTTGLSFFNYIQPLWYVSSLIIVLPIFSYICIKHNDLFKNIVIWLAPALIYGYFCKLGGGIAAEHALMRAFAGLCIGALCFYISKNIKVDNKLRMKLLIHLGILLTIGGVLYFAWTVRHSNSDFDIIIVYAIQIILLSLDNTECKNKLIYKIGVCLGKISLPMYVMHTFVYIVVRDQFEYSIKIKFMITIICTVLLSVVLVCVDQIVRSRMYKHT